MKIKANGYRSPENGVFDCNCPLKTISRIMEPFSKYSLPNGLELLLDVEAFDYSRSASGAEGVVVSILHHLDIPIMKNTGGQNAPKIPKFYRK